MKIMFNDILHPLTCTEPVLCLLISATRTLLLNTQYLHNKGIRRCAFFFLLSRNVFYCIGCLSPGPFNQLCWTNTFIFPAPKIFCRISKLGTSYKIFNIGKKSVSYNYSRLQHRFLLVQARNILIPLLLPTKKCI